jgi:hypothetical protein
MAYADMLRDPKWQRKRLEVLKDADFSCENCGNNEEELSVHHRFYKKGAKPWEYENGDLVVYCKKCHEEWHEAKKELDIIIGNIPDKSSLHRIIGYALAVSGDDIFPSDIHSRNVAVGVSDYYKTTLTVIKYITKTATHERVPLTIPRILSLQTEDTL